MAELEKVLFTARATARGGRNGSVRTDDGVVALDLSLPKSAGGEGLPGRTTPEDLFACGYAACFGSAVELVAGQKGVALGEVAIDAAVSIGPTKGGGFGLAVQLSAHLPGVEPELAREIVDGAHAICPYSNAIRGNVGVALHTRT